MSDFFLKFHSDLENLPMAEDLWKYFLKSQGIEEEKLYWLNLAIHEVVSNAIVHGNRRNKKKWVFLKIEKKKAKLKVEVLDQGKCRKIPKVEDACCTKNLLKNHGRGLFIVKRIVEDIRFKILKGGNLKVILKFSL